MAGRSIICGVTASNDTCAVAHVAERLAKHFNAELVLVHVTGVPVPAGYAAGMSYDRLEEDAIRSGNQLIDRVAEECRLVSCQRHVEIGEPAIVLVRLSEAPDVEMVVVGNRGRGPLKAAVLGSVSRELAIHAKCPVVVVPREAATFRRPRPAEER